mgnify:CR=1 FL=1
MKLYNGVSFQLLFHVSCHRCSFGNNKKLTSLLIRANIYITTEDNVPQLSLNQQGMLGKKVAVWSMQHSDHFVQFH